MMVPHLLRMAMVLYILPAVTGFYHFSLSPPLSGLGVLANPRWLQRRLFCLFVHRGILIRYGVGVLPSYLSWHASSGSSSSLLLLGSMSSQ